MMAKYVDLSPEQIRSMNDNELRSVVRSMMDAGNHRIKRLLEDEIGKESRLGQEAMAKREKQIAKGEKPTPFYSMKGVDTRKELLAEYKRMRNELSPTRKTTSLKGVKAINKAISSRIGGSPTPDFWKVYRMLEETEGYTDASGRTTFVGGYDSTEVQRMIYRHQNGDTESVYEKVRDLLNYAYEVEEERDARSSEELFELDDDEEDLFDL